MGLCLGASAPPPGGIGVRGGLQGEEQGCLSGLFNAPRRQEEQTSVERHRRGVLGTWGPYWKTESLNTIFFFET